GLVLVVHAKGDRPWIAVDPDAPVAYQRRDGLEPLALARPLDANACQTREDGAVRVLHHHHAVAPAVEGELVRRGEGAGVSGLGVVHEGAVAVADHAVGAEEEANRDRPTVGVATYPAQHAVVGPQLAQSPLRLVAAVRALGVDERLVGLGLRNDLRLRGGQRS